MTRIVSATQHGTVPALPTTQDVDLVLATARAAAGSGSRAVVDSVLVARHGLTLSQVAEVAPPSRAAVAELAASLDGAE